MRQQYRKDRCTYARALVAPMETIGADGLSRRELRRQLLVAELEQARASLANTRSEDYASEREYKIERFKRQQYVSDLRAQLAELDAEGQ